MVGLLLASGVAYRLLEVVDRPLALRTFSVSGPIEGITSLLLYYRCNLHHHSLLYFSLSIESLKNYLAAAYLPFGLPNVAGTSLIVNIVTLLLFWGPRRWLFV